VETINADWQPITKEHPGHMRPVMLRWKNGAVRAGFRFHFMFMIAPPPSSYLEDNRPAEFRPLTEAERKQYSGEAA
jgi:hypothetical protein